MELLEEKLGHLGTLFDADGWRNAGVTGSIISETLDVPGSSINCFRSSVRITATAADIVDYVWRTYDSRELMEDDEILEYEIVETVTPNARVCRQVNKLPWPLWPRETVFMQHRFEHEGVVYILAYSTDHSKAPLQPAKYVRSISRVSGYVLMPSVDGTLVYRIAHVDPAGMIPASIVNSCATKTTAVLSRLAIKFA
ncbi:START domain-containing protein [uncultured virus]|nr:START domain-containing protein [uncultured virus]